MKREEQFIALYPTGYQEARLKFSSAFLEMFDGLVEELRFFQNSNDKDFAEVRRLLSGADELAVLRLYNHFVALSQDPQRCEWVQQDWCIQGLKHGSIRFNELLSSSIQSLKQKSLPSQKTQVSETFTSFFPASEKDASVANLTTGIHSQNRLAKKEKHTLKQRHSMAGLFLTRKRPEEEGDHKTEGVLQQPDACCPSFSFFIDVLAHPFTCAASVVMGIAGVLLLTLITPASAGVVALGAIALVSSVGLFSASCVVLSIRNTEEATENLSCS